MANLETHGFRVYINFCTRTFQRKNHKFQVNIGARVRVGGTMSEHLNERTINSDLDVEEQVAGGGLPLEYMTQ